MKRTRFTCLCLLLTTMVNAQMAYWLVRPQYDRIDYDPQSEVFLAVRKDSTFILNDSGQLLAASTWQLHPFRSGKAVAVMPRTDLLKGFYTDEGKFIAIEYGNIAYHHPYFHDGHLLVFRDGVYRYINAQGSLLYNQCERAYPFFNGYAACREYKDPAKKKGAYYRYL